MLLWYRRRLKMPDLPLKVRRRERFLSYNQYIG